MAVDVGDDGRLAYHFVNAIPDARDLDDYRRAGADL